MWLVLTCWAVVNVDMLGVVGVSMLRVVGVGILAVTVLTHGSGQC